MKKSEVSFEEAMEKLEKIVADLEKGDLTLDKSVENFKEGIEISQYCSKKLDEAEKSITILLKDKDGNVKEEDFEA